MIKIKVSMYCSYCLQAAGHVFEFFLGNVNGSQLSWIHFWLERGVVNRL